MRSLRSTLIYQITAVIVCLLAVSGVAIWGIHGLNQDLSLATRGYERLRDVYEIGSHVLTARTLVSLNQPELARALVELDAAETKLKIERDESAELGGGATPDLMAIFDRVHSAQAMVRQAIERGNQQVDTTAFQQVMGATAFSASQIRSSIQAAQLRADAKRRFTVVAVSSVSGLLIAGAIVIGVWQYRSVMRPMTELNQGVRHLSSGEFSRKLPVHGHLEFADLARDFNQMATQLDELYGSLERQVEEKSRELVRSQHLASVGFLAAGVAHEINNPLGVITGFAEFTQQQLQQQPNSAATEQIDKALQAIIDEAFRCKQITEKLLSMARSTEAPRSPVNLAAVAEEVIPLLRALREYEHRPIRFASEGDTTILANESEMKQVMLNLLTNALEAVDDHTGRVDVSVRRIDKSVMLVVKDNGRGMTQQTLARVFEPFFTLPREERRGTGLGLSIAHAIVDVHGGSIRASSAGLGQGSEFIVTLPVTASLSLEGRGRG